MSRSFRKTAKFGVTTAPSEKEDKRLANRVLRRTVRVILDEETEDCPDLREVSNVWSFAKDGKIYWSDAPPKHFRK
jgi:hypothetical protein